MTMLLTVTFFMLLSSYHQYFPALINTLSFVNSGIKNTKNSLFNTSVKFLLI